LHHTAEGLAIAEGSGAESKGAPEVSRSEAPEEASCGEVEPRVLRKAKELIVMREAMAVAELRVLRGAIAELEREMRSVVDESRQDAMQHVSHQVNDRIFADRSRSIDTYRHG